MSDRKLAALALASLLVASALTVAGSVGVAAAANAAGNAPTDVGTAAGGGDWPTQGHDERNTGYAPTVTGPRTGATERWEFDPGVGFQTSPVVANGTVYAAEVEWYDGDGTFYALNATTGAVEWYRNGSFSDLGTAAAVTDGVVYVRNGSDVTALDAATGAELWAYATSSSVTTPATVADGTVYAANSDGNVIALNASTGAEEWTYATGGYVDGAPAVADGRVYVGNTDGDLYALDGETGAKAWNYSTTDDINAPTVANGRVYFGTDGDAIYALDAATGTEEWSLGVAGLVPGHVAVADETLYASTSTAGRLYAVDAATGTERWNRTIGDSASAPAVDGDTVYVTGDDTYGYVYGFDADTGRQRWRYETELASVLHSSPAVTNGTLYVGIDNRGPGGLYAITEPPAVRADATPTTPTVGETVTLDASASSSRFGTVTSYEWDLDGDGTVEATGERVTTSYDRAGGYAVTLEVTDDRGINATTQLWIPVLDPDRGPLFDEWPTPGHDAARTGTATATGIVGSARARWRRPLDLQVTGEPLVANDTVYAGTGVPPLSGDGDPPLFYALNASTGAQVWNYSAESATQFAGGTVGDGTVYAGDDTGRVHAIDTATGTAEWTIALDSRIEQAPVSTDDTVLVGTRTRELRPVPILTLYALDAATGEERWNYSVDVDTGLAAANGTVYVGDNVYNRETRSSYGELYALNVSTGEPAWTEEGGEVTATYRTAGDISTVTVRDGTVYGANDRGHAFALDAATGTERWNRSVGSSDRFSVPRPAASGDRLYLTNDENVTAVNATTGDVVWNYSADSLVAPDTAVVNGTVYVRVFPRVEGGDGLVVGLDADTGTREWTVTVGQPSAGLAVVGDRFYVPSVDADRGTPLLSAYEGTGDTGPTAVARASATSVRPGATVSFDATASTDDTRIVDTRWRFGDGGTATGAQVDHTYTTEGTYTATVTVTDTAGYRATETVTVSVTAPDTDGSSGGGGGGGFSVGGGGATAPTTETVPTTETETETETETVPTTEMETATATEDAPETAIGSDENDPTTTGMDDPATTGQGGAGTDTDADSSRTTSESAAASGAAVETTTSSGPGFTSVLVVVAVVLLAVFAWQRR